MIIEITVLNNEEMENRIKQLEEDKMQLLEELKLKNIIALKRKMEYDVLLDKYIKLQKQKTLLEKQK